MELGVQSLHQRPGDDNMGSVSFTYAKTPKSIGGFEIDLFLNERYVFGNKITEFPLENGAIVSDHVVEEPDEVFIKAFIGKAKMAALGEEGDQAGGTKGRIIQSYNELLRLKRNRQPLTLVTGLGPYPNMVIDSFDIDRRAETGADLMFDMSFKRVVIVRSQSTSINFQPAALGGHGDQVSGGVNLGTTGTSRTDPASQRAREEWRIAVRNNVASPRDYEERWGEPPP